MSAAAATPTPEQLAAIRLRDGDVLLDAGAGSGKTRVLAERYCELLADGGQSQDAILACTFTEKAAAELRERIRSELRLRLAEAADREIGERLGEQLAAFTGSWITTIHGFCRRLLAAHPVAAGVDPRFKVMDEPETARVARGAFDQALEDFIRDGSPEREGLLAAYRLEGMRELILSAYAELRSRGEEDPGLPELSPGDPALALKELGRAAGAALGAGKQGEGQRRKLEQLQALASAETPPSLDELEGLSLASRNGAIERCDAALRALVARLAEAGEGGVAYRGISVLMRLFHERFEEAKAARSGLDFEDLQLLARRLLRGTEIGELYRERFKHVLIDEFQDTNRLQLGLIEALRGAETRLFLVGDEFQSIYGFRHAELEVFREQRDAYESRDGARVLALRGNFRSRPEIIAAANHIGETMLNSHRPLTVGAEAAPAARGEDSALELLITTAEGWDEEQIKLDLALDDRTRPECVAEARFLAQRLGALCEAGVPASEMVVLLRAFTRVDAFEEALARAGLRPYVVGGRGYWSQQQVADLRCLLSVIANPLDDEALLGALASPACGAKPDALWILRRAAGRGAHLWPALERAVGVYEARLAEPEWLEQLPAEERSRLARFHAAISSLRERAPLLGLEDLIEQAIADTGYELAVLSRLSGELRLANARKLMRMAREFEGREGRRLRGFLDFLSFRTPADDEPVAASESEDHDGVRLMTIHAAKGLEFGVVAVADLGRQLLAGARAPDLVLGRGPRGALRAGLRLARLGYPSLDLYEREALLAEAREQDAAEALRLFYVAATRPRERLLLSGIASRARPKEIGLRDSVLERLIASLGIEIGAEETRMALKAPATRPGLAGRFGAPELLVRVNRASPGRAEELCARAAPSPQERPSPVASPPILALSPPPPATPPLSYSSLEAYRRCGYRFYVERVLGLSATDGTEAPDRRPSERAERLGFGSAVHELLAWSAARRWIDPPASLVERVLAANGVSPRGSHGEGRALSLVRGFASSALCAELSAPRTRLRSELPLLVRLKGSVIRGSIDLLAEPPGGAPTVVDYKTDRLGDGTPAELAERYTLQRDLYALAVAEARSCPSVRVAYVFLESPEEPVIVELDGARIGAARAELERLVGEISTARFEVTSEPSWELCADCPARRRLCPSPAGKSSKASAPSSPR